MDYFAQAGGGVSYNDGQAEWGQGMSDDPFNLPWINPNKKFASTARATIARAAWEDYLNRFQPIEDELIAGVMDPEEWLDKRLSSIHVSADRAFQAADVGADMLRGRYGIQRNAAESKYGEMDSARSEALARIDAVNNTRRHVIDRNMAVIGGGAGGTRNAIQEGFG